MKFATFKMWAAISIILALAAFFAGVMADRCSSGIATASESDGNWYCSPVKAIQYQNVGIPGTYHQVTGMIGDGKCSFIENSFSGPLSPFDEEVGQPGLTL